MTGDQEPSAVCTPEFSCTLPSNTQPGKGASDSGQWLALVAGAAKADVRSYVNPSARYAGGSVSYLSEAKKVPSDAQVVVFVGGTGDQYDAQLTRPHPGVEQQPDDRSVTTVLEGVACPCT